MARMHPEEIEELENPTEGERRVFRFLREAARADKDFIGWYEPAIGEQGIEPDFVLLGNHHGLLVLEVKDWRIDQIEEADSINFKIWIGGKEKNRTNPDRQARGIPKIKPFGSIIKMSMIYLSLLSIFWRFNIIERGFQ